MPSPRFVTAVRRVLLATAILSASVAPALAEGPTVFAAASLKDVLSSIAEAWKTETGKQATLSFAGSSAIARQIEEGAPADIFISADLAWMDHLDGKGLIDKATRVDLLGNAIVLVSPKDSDVTTTIAKGFPLADLLGDGRLAIANVDAVPAGVYGKAALENLGVWDGVKDKLAQSENVRAALLLVSRGEAPLGIVYATDAKADPGVRVVATFPEQSHAPIVYPAALVEGSSDPDARAFLAFLSSPQASRLFTEAGFTVLGATN